MVLLASLQAWGVSQYLYKQTLSAIQRVRVLSSNSSSWPGDSSSVAQQREQLRTGTSIAPDSSSPCQSAAADSAGAASNTSPALWVRSCSQAGGTPTAVASWLLLLSGQQRPAGLVLPQLGVSSGSIISRGYAAAAPTKLRPRLINSRISKAETPEQVAALVEQHAVDMDAIHISTACSRLSKLCRERTTSAQAAAVQRALRVLEPLVQQHQQLLDVRGLANIIHACHYLERKETMQQLLPVFLQPRVLATAGTQNLANVLWAAAKSGIVLQDSQLQQLLQRLCAQLQQADPQAIANSVYAVAEMGKQLPERQLQQLISALCGKLQQADPQSISNTLWAVATMGQRLPPEQLQQLLVALCSKLNRANPQNVANTLWAVATMGQRLPPAQLQQLLDALTEQLHEAVPQALANTLWAVATMGQQVPPAQLQQLVDAFTEQLHAATPLAVANMLWAVAKMEQRVPPEHLQQLLDALTEQLHEATPQAVANTLWACGCQFKVLPSQLLTALEQQPQQLQRLLAAATAQELANMTLACAWLYFRRPFLLDGLLQQVMVLLQHQGSRGLNCQDSANLYWSVAVLDLRQHASQVLQLAAACSNQWGNTIPADMLQLYEAHRWLLDYQLPAGSSNGLAGVLTQQQLEQCRSCQEQRLRAAAKVSKLQQSVFGALKNLPDVSWQQQPDMEQQTADNAAVIDIVAVTARGAKLAVEVDGPWHFVQPGNQLDGQTQRRNRVLAARGYTVVSIPYWEGNGLASKQQQVDYLQRKLAEHL